MHNRELENLNELKTKVSSVKSKSTQEELYRLAAQVRRKTMSAPLSFAKGLPKSTEKEKSNLFNIVLVSIVELEDKLAKLENLEQLDDSRRLLYDLSRISSLNSGRK